MADIYLPNTHESIPSVIKVGGICYEYVETIDRDVHQEDHCWDEVQYEFDNCDDCCYPNIEYMKCPFVFNCNGCVPRIPNPISVTISGLNSPLNGANGTHSLVQTLNSCSWTLTTGGNLIQVLWGSGWWDVQVNQVVNPINFYIWEKTAGPCDYTGSYPYFADMIGQGPGATAVVS